MYNLTAQILKKDLPAVFEKGQIRNLPSFPELKNALKSGEIIWLTGDFYTLNNHLRKSPIDVNPLSARIDPTSYVSTKSALRNNDWIPEHVYVCTCVSAKKTVDINCGIIAFYYVLVNQKNPFKGTEIVDYYGTPFRQAKPLKALADLVAAANLDWVGTDPLLNSMRIEEDSLETIRSADFDEIQGNYIGYPNVDLFLDSLRKELSL